MASRFKLQIVHDADGTVYEWVPGSRVEVDFVAALAARVAQRNVGYFRSTAAVAQEVQRATEELIYDLKAQVRG